MRAYFNMPTSEFVGQLRDIAIKAGARPQVIDCLDAITEAPSEDDIEAQCNAAHDEGEKTGRSDIAHEWRMARKLVCDKLDNDGIGLTERQYVQILEIIDSMEPEA